METYKFNITEEIEVKFPHYRKYEHFYYKVLNQYREIKVSYIPDGVCQYANISYNTIATGNTFRYGSYEITEDEFNETFLRAIQLINTFKNK